MAREKFGSRLGFILISAGCAIGLGNVWRFPYIAGAVSYTHLDVYKRQGHPHAPGLDRPGGRGARRKRVRVRRVRKECDMTVIGIISDTHLSLIHISIMAILITLLRVVRGLGSLRRRVRLVGRPGSIEKT